MKRSSVVSVLGLIVVLFVSVAWKYERDNVVFTGDAVHDGKTEFNGAVQVDGNIDVNGTVDFATGSIPSASLPATISDTTLISNKVMKLYGSNVVVVAGGTLTIPDDSIAVAKIGAGSLPTDVVATSVSNDTGYVYISNLTVKAGGTLAIPAGSIGVAAISNGLSSNFVVYGEGNTNFTFFITNGTVRGVTVSGP